MNHLCATLAFLFAYLVFAPAPEVRVDYTPAVRSSR